MSFVADANVAPGAPTSMSSELSSETGVIPELHVPANPEARFSDTPDAPAADVPQPPATPDMPGAQDVPATQISGHASAPPQTPSPAPVESLPTVPLAPQPSRFVRPQASLPSFPGLQLRHPRRAVLVAAGESQDESAPDAPRDGRLARLASQRYAQLVPSSAARSFGRRLSAWMATSSRRLATHIWERRVSILLQIFGWLAGIGVALLAGVLLIGHSIDNATSNELVATGFDGERAHLITAFCLALVVSGASGLVVLRRGAAWLGGFLWLVATYLWPLAQQAQQPSAGGNAQAIASPSTLAHVLITLAALGVLFAGAGAVLGEAVGRMVLPPLVSLGQRLFTALTRSQKGAKLATIPNIVRPLAAAVLVAVALVIGVPDVGSLISYGVTTELYQPPVTVPHSQQGTVEQANYVSPALGGATRSFMIYLPPSYSWADFQTTRFPTIYLLHGTPGGFTDWFSAGHVPATADAASVARRARDAIIVSPDGNGALYRTSAWANSFDNKQRMEDAIATDLVAFIDSHYRTLADPADRAIGGLSEGAYGAANIALHRPDVFSKVMSLDGFYETTNSPVFGPYGTGYRNYNSPSTYLQTPEGQKAGHDLTFIVAVGTKDTFYNDGLAFVKKLQAAGIPVQLIQTDGGHNWTQWSQQFAQSLPLLAAVHQNPNAGSTT